MTEQATQEEEDLILEYTKAFVDLIDRWTATFNRRAERNYDPVVANDVVVQTDKLRLAIREVLDLFRDAADRVQDFERRRQGEDTT